ncbi:hypothetical protein BG20_I0207 [Candidatus Nitrosarchaeum limnium BG20]|jgi:RimJ/RimL family protein N-acetyltransferase|uniref:N-acetyltransferase domain-containing protein n=2 Tax=Nitrosarchaeum TaxID=1007082 RepID=S2EKQ2_9ARCH|nr:hypothetical protein BG20_I0207 [Candidatus Nitrosarchaeum limnium BG20]
MDLKNIRFKKVTVLDTDFLYRILEQRNPNNNISHKKMPTLLQHRKFIESDPYSYWYVIYFSNLKIGTVYLTSINEIGLHIKNEFQNLQIEKTILNKLFRKHPRNRYLVNINPKNKRMILFLKNNGFNLLQYTYELSIKRKNKND